MAALQCCAKYEVPLKWLLELYWVRKRGILALLRTDPRPLANDGTETGLDAADGVPCAARLTCEEEQAVLLGHNSVGGLARVACDVLAWSALKAGPRAARRSVF